MFDLQVSYYSYFIITISDRFRVDWNRVQWSDLRKPLHSGLAAALFIVQSFNGNANGVPVVIEQQAAWYQKLRYPNDGMAAYNYTQLAGRLDSGM